MTTLSTEPKDLKILVHGTPRNLASGYRNQLNSYFNTHKKSEQSLYWEILISSIRHGLAQYCEQSTNAEMKERAHELTDKLSAQSHPADSEAIAKLLQQIVQMWESEEFQHDFNSMWNPEVLHTKYWLKTFIPLAAEVLNSKRDITDEELVDSPISVTGIIEDHHSYGNTRVSTTLIGGRRAERRKWLHAFENVSATMLFISAEGLLVEESTGYIDDRGSLMTLFKEVSTSRFLGAAPLILFISRIHLLEDMINGGADVKKYLPSDYNGDINARSIVLHFIYKLCENNPKDKPLFVICGNLVDKQAMQLIIPYIFQTLILSSDSTKQLSNVIVDTERNVVIYYPITQQSTFDADIRKVIAGSEPSSLCSLLKDSDHISETCKSLLNDEVHADLNLRVGESTLRAHSLILHARVPELLTLWTDNGTTKDIVVTDLDCKATQLLMEYIYTDRVESIEAGEATVVQEVLKLLKFADKFALQPFMFYLCKAMADKMNISQRSKKESMDTQLVQELLQFGKAANSDYLQLKCTEYLLFLEEDNTPVKVTKEKKPKKRAGCIVS
jgi:hypothetical protein